MVSPTREGLRSIFYRTVERWILEYDSKAKCSGASFCLADGSTIEIRVMDLTGDKNLYSDQYLRDDVFVLEFKKRGLIVLKCLAREHGTRGCREATIVRPLNKLPLAGGQDMAGVSVEGESEIISWTEKSFCRLLEKAFGESTGGGRSRNPSP